jgi:hypothetical protein
VLSADRDLVVSHGSAACLLQMPLRPGWRELVHLTKAGVTGTRTEHGVKHHRASCDQPDLTVTGSLRSTGLARTAVDTAREHGFEDGVVACDAAKRLGATDADLQRVLGEVSQTVRSKRSCGPRSSVRTGSDGWTADSESLG